MGHKPRLMTAGIVACLLFLLASANANKCIVGCHGMNAQKTYVEGHTYVYDLKGSSKTLVSEAQGSSDLELTGSVELAIKPDCQHQLRIKDLRLNGAPVGSEDLAKKALQFNYHGGHIDSSVCTEQGDSQASLNIKRAVASLFQSAVLQDSGSTSHHEMDVFGGCKSDFTFQKEGEVLVVKKYRNLGDCSYRESISQGLITAVFDPNAQTPSSPLLNSHLTTEQRFVNGVLHKAVSTENYALRPFSNGDAGAKTAVTMELVYKSDKPTTEPLGSVSQPKSLIFDPPHPVLQDSPEPIVKALKGVKHEDAAAGVKEHAAVKFAELVKILGASSKNAIGAVYQKIKSGNGFDKASDSKIFLEALFRAGSGEAAEIVVDMIKNKEISELQAFAFYASLPLIRHVHLPTVSAIVSLLDQPHLPRIGYLGVGQIIGKYCADHECNNVPEVKAALSKFVSKIEGANKFETRKKESDGIAALKGLGNARYHDKATSEKIAKIATDKKVKNRVRVAAIDALPSTCSAPWKKQVTEILANREEDSEVRIKSYLALMRCPDVQVAASIKEILDKETINQVGSFITSHLRNLRASADPNKQEAKKYFAEIKPKTKFPEDFRKFSFNNELSYNVGAFGLGSSAESNVIYSQKSFVPRSASLNLTTEIFGHSFNFLELDSRVENLDRLIEDYFGPKGTLKPQEIVELAGDGSKRFVDVYEKIKSRLHETVRNRREVKQESLNKFAKKVKLDTGKVNDDNLDLDLSVKMFGVELVYLDYQATESDANPDAFINKIFKMIDHGLEGAKDFDKHLSNHVHFLNIDVVYPTGLGLPMTLGVTGDSVVHLKASGKIDIAAIIKAPESASVKIALEPSAAISLVGSMVVQGFDKESGLRMVSTFHTSTGSDITVKILDSKGIDVNFGVPQKKQEIVSISSQVFFIGKNNEDVSPKFANGKEHQDCFEQFSSLLGVTVCGHISYPYESIESVHKRPLFPLSGPGKFAVSLENNDVSNYHFKLYHDLVPETKTLEVLLETPNSKTNRKVAFKVTGALGSNAFFKMALDSPYKTISGEARLKNDQKEKSIILTGTNDVDTYLIRLGVEAQSGNKYKPILEYKVPEHIAKLASAKTGIKKGNNGREFTVNGDVEINDVDGGKECKFNKVVLMAADRELASLDGSVLSKPNEIKIDTTIAHGEEKLTMKLDALKGDKKHSLDFSLVPSKNPNIGFKVHWHLDRHGDRYDHEFVFIHGPDLESKVNRLTISDQLSYKKSEAQPSGTFAPLKMLTALKTESKVTWPANGLLSEFEMELSPTSLDTEVKFEYGKFKVGSELELEVDKEHARDCKLKFKANFLESKFAVKLEHKKLDEHKRELRANLEFPGGSKYDLDAKVTYDVDKTNMNVLVDADVGFNGKKVKVDYGVEANPQKFVGHAILKVDSVKHLDFLLKLKSAPNPRGNLNLQINNELIIGGQYTYENGKGNANIQINVPSLHRKIAGTGELTVTGNKYLASGEISLDGTKRLKVTSDSEVTQESLDSKNVVEVGKYKTEVNVKGNLKKNDKTGYQTSGSAEITLPNDHFVVLNVDHELARHGEKNRLSGTYQLTDSLGKGGKTAKLAYEGQFGWVNGAEHEYIAEHNILAQTYEGKDLKLHLAASNEKERNSDKRKCNFVTGIDGSVIPKPFLFVLSTNYNSQDADWKIKSSLGKELGVTGQGTLSRGNMADKPCTREVQLEFKFPSEKLSSLSLKTSESLLIPHDREGQFHYTGSGGLTYNGDKNLKGEVEIRHAGVPDNHRKSEGEAKVKLTLLNNEPMSFATSYKYDPSDETKKSSGTLDVKYGDKEASLTSELAYTTDLRSVSFHAKGKTPVEKFHNVELKISRKKSPDEMHEFDVLAVADEKKYTLSSQLQLSPTITSARVVMTCPEGKTEIFSKVQDHGNNFYTGDWKVESPKGFVSADGSVKISSVDDFTIEFNFDSDRIKSRKIHGEIGTKPGSNSGKKIHITVTSDGKNIITGSTDYSQREQAGKVIVEGNGNLKIGENTRSSKFTYSRKQLTREVDGEVGVAILLNINFEPSAVIGELKLSNKEIHVFNSYCEQSKDCAHFKLQSAFNSDETQSQMNHQLTVQVNLKKFNVPVEFGLETNTKYQLKEPTFDHTAHLFVDTSKDRSQYSSKVYVHPKESGIILTLPSREVAIISSYEIPKSRHTGAVKMDVSVYLDRKNKPNDKTSFVASGDLNVEKNSGSIVGEAKFIYPSQTKDMVVSGKLHYGGDNLLDANLDFDVFAKKSQKISVVGQVIRTPVDQGYNVTGDLKVTSHGQQLKVDLKQHLALTSKAASFGSSLSYTDQHQKPKSVGIFGVMDSSEAGLTINMPDKELVDLAVSYKISKNLVKLGAMYAFLEQTPVIANFEMQDFNNFKYSFGEHGDTKNKLSANGRIVLGQLAEVHADHYKNGEKKNLFNVLVHLDETNFLKTDFSYSKDNIVTAISVSRERSVKLAKQLKEAGEKVAEEVVVEFKDLAQHLKKATPNLKPLVEYYEGELVKLKNELHADETIKEIQATLYKVFGGVIVAVTETLKQLAEHMTELNKQFHEIVKNITEAVKETYPHLKESFDKIFQAGVEIFDAAMKLGTVYLEEVLRVISEHQKEIKQLLGVATDLFQDIAKIIVKAASQIEKDVKDFVFMIIQQVKALPIFEFIKEKYAELENYQVPDSILIPIEEAYNQLKNLLPTEELRNFFTITYDYVMKHVKRQEVDDSLEIKKIWGAGVEVIQSLLSLIQSNTTFDKLFNFYIVRIPSDISAFKKLPGIASLKVSVLNLLKNHELPSPADIYYAYRPTLHLGDIIPPFSQMGMFVEGGHFFTFDGRHVTLAGTCDYIVAQDMRDGNFSVVANLASGKLTSVTVTAPGESITLKSSGNILVNGKPAEYPASTKNLHAFMTLPIVNVKSDYGIHLMCTQKSPMSCGLHVSGFYLGRIRGILGDANNEPYDDFTLPSGHITDDPTEFGNAYKLNSGCPAAPAVDHKSHQRNPTCTEYFSGNSPMSSCFNYVNPANYREACDHATSAGTPDAACLISGAYWVACLEQRVFISIPDTCGKCKVKSNEIPVGETFSVKIPQKQADVIFVVEQDIRNEKVFKDLIQPLINDIRAEFKQHGITDVHVALIGYGERMKWPQHYTIGGSTNIDGDVNNMKFMATEPLISLEEAKTGSTATRLKYLRQRLDVELGTFKLTGAYEEAVRYPFRAGAAKAVVGVIASPCEKSPLPLSLQQLRLAMGSKVYRDLGLTYYHVSYLDEILVSGKPQKNVIGFDAENAYTYADSKKKPLEGNSDMKNNLVLANNDVCANFAVSSGGAAFAVDHLHEAKPNQKKQFAQVAARRIVEGLVNNEIEEDCSCRLAMGIDARAQCEIVGHKKKDRHNKGGAKA